MLLVLPPPYSSPKQSDHTQSHFFHVFLKIFLIGITFFVNDCDSACDSIDHDSLLSFNLSITTSASTSPLNWSLAYDCCSWEGIGCDSTTGRVTDLSLPSRGLGGTISPSVLNLTSLTHLNLSHNSLSGNLPDGFFASLNQLQVIDLSINRLDGVIAQLPSTIKNLNLSSNRFHGTIQSPFIQPPSELQTFDVSNNTFSGSIPSSICNFSSSNSITYLDFSNNDFDGLIPQGFGMCTNLLTLKAGFCNFSGSLPQDIYDVLTLQELYLPGNELSGPIDQGIVNLTNLKSLVLYGNNLTGEIPQDIGRLDGLEQIQLHINQLSGTIPQSLTKCTRLTTLYLRVNQLEGELSVFDFSGFSQLRSVDLGNNFFNGSLPESLFSCMTLTAVRLATNRLTGEILPNIALLPSLSFLSLSNNSFTNIKSAITILSGCKNLSTLTLSKNFQNEELPSDESFTGAAQGFQNIQVLALGACGFTGQVPTWLQNMTKLEVVDLSFNNLTGSIPGWLNELKNLFYIDLSNNNLSGEFPIELTRMQRLAIESNSDLIQSSNLELPVFVGPYNVSKFQYNQLSSLPPTIYLGKNSISGTIPVEIGNLKFLIALDLSNNGFYGNIPDSISNLINLEQLDLSENNLTGSIPSSFKNLHFLSKFSVANNDLNGSIPTGGQFNTFQNSSFQGNPKLCGQIVNRPCGGGNDQPQTNPSANNKRGMHKKTIIVVALVIFSGIFSMTLLRMYFVFSKRNLLTCGGDLEKTDQNGTISFNSSGVFPEVPQDTSLVKLFPNDKTANVEDLTILDILKATDNFNQSNIIGCGGFGLVYKANLEDGTKLAIKKLSGDMGLIEREFKAEVESLSSAQHKNLVALQGYCVHDGVRLLIYSYMENGSLDYWLHEKPDGASKLTWQMRLRIAQGASQGVAYMHQECDPHIVHRDLKSSNILLDQSFEAHVADFGLARFIRPYETHVTTELVGTLGYIPPEYSQSLIATLKGDMYSFGVVMLELLTGKRPVELFKPRMTRELVTWVQKMRNEGKPDEIFDPLLRNKGFEEEMLKMLDVACMCVNNNPSKRPTIKEVVNWLKDIESNRQAAV